MGIPLVFQIPRQTALNLGVVASGAKAYFFKAETTTPQDTYTTAALTTQHAHPVVADSSGLFPIIYLDDELQYRVQIKDSSDVLIYDEDKINDPSNRAPFYKQTTAEASAGVTPTDTGYPEGDERRYGAVSGLSSDQSTAIQTAMDIAGTAGGRGYVDIGRRDYTVSTLTWPSSNFELRGNGGFLRAHSSIPAGGGIIVTLGDGNQSILNNTYGAGVISDRSTTFLDRLRIRGIRFVANANAIKGIWATGLTGVGYIRDCFFDDFEDSCIALNNTYSFSIVNNDGRGRSGNGVCLDLANPSNSDGTADVNALRIHGNHFGVDAERCMAIYKALAIECSGNVWESGPVDGPYFEDVNGLHYAGNYHEMDSAGNYGMTLGKADGTATVQGAEISGNHFQMSTNSEAAILLNSLAKSRIGPNFYAGPTSVEIETGANQGATIRNEIWIRDLISTYLNETAATLPRQSNHIRVLEKNPGDPREPYEITPSQLTGNTNDWSPTDVHYAEVIRMSSDGNYDLTGLAEPDAGITKKYLVNVGSFTITLKEFATSAAVNRFRAGADVAVGPHEGVLLIYDRTDTVWRVISKHI